MSQEIRINTDTIDALVAGLEHGVSVLNKSRETAVSISQAVGHPRLALKVISFSDSWKRSREEIEERLKTLIDSLFDIGTEIELVEKMLADAADIDMPTPVVYKL